jgi:hypothetical protein
VQQMVDGYIKVYQQMISTQEEGAGNIQYEFA